jgi:hypothetical protein
MTQGRLRDKAEDQPVGLATLDQVNLNKQHQRRLDKLTANCGGSAVWRARKQVEARSLFQLSQLAPLGRMTVVDCDLRAALKMMIALEVPVPCRDESGELLIHHGAMLGLTYMEETLRQPSPGYAFISILGPRGIWHANVAANVPHQPLCLGATLPMGIPCVELVIAAYGALSMQSVMVDERDPAGVLNADAARWWQQNTHRIPLTRTPFLSPKVGANTSAG